MQCAGGAGRGACNGDSGGPLVCRQEDTGRWYQVGGQGNLLPPDSNPLCLISGRDCELRAGPV